MPKAEPVPYVPGAGSAESSEQETVHEVYDAIASHFSQTRRKPWPLVTAFLDSLPPNTIGLDSGAGNGSHLPLAIYPPSTTSLGSRDANAKGQRFSIALDHSQNLLEIAKKQITVGGECLKGELGYGGWRGGVFDWAISIAAVHHLTTHARRVDSVRALIRPLVLNKVAPFSRFMVYVWAYEQGNLSKRKMGAQAEQAAPVASTSNSSSTSASTSTQISDIEAGQQSQPSTTPTPTTAPQSSTTQPIEPPTSKLGSRTVPQNFPNAFPPASDPPAESSRTRAKTQDVLVPWVYQPPSTSKGSDLGELEKKVYHRYYHLFAKGELEDLVIEAAKLEGFKVITDSRGDDGGGETVNQSGGDGKWMKVKAVGWEMDNWYLEGEVGVN